MAILLYLPERSSENFEYSLLFKYTNTSVIPLSGTGIDMDKGKSKLSINNCLIDSSVTVNWNNANTFTNENITNAAGSSHVAIKALSDPNYVRDIKSTDWMLYDSAYDDVYVTAGKTGFLNESGWNVVVRLHPMGQSEDKSVLVVVLGSPGRRESFDNAEALAYWAWQNFDWSRPDLNLASN